MKATRTNFTQVYDCIRTKESLLQRFCDMYYLRASFTVRLLKQKVRDCVTVIADHTSKRKTSKSVTYIKDGYSSLT